MAPPMKTALLWVSVTLIGRMSGAANEPLHLRYAFGDPIPGYTAVKPTDHYNANRGYGFDLGSTVEFSADTPVGSGGFVTGGHQRPFFFSARVDPGVYRVTITLGDRAAETVTT